MREASDAVDLIDTVQQALGQMGGMHSARDALTASATAEHGRITVVVNASGSIIKTMYAEDIKDLSFGQIAKATVQAAQAAAAEVTAKKQALIAPLEGMRSRMPRAEDLFEGLAELRAQMPQHVPAPLTPPSERAGAERHSDGHRILDR
ncbi:YbaB/EbfC family DNA-binding protein [Nocardia salmonicida]|uniref:YbaB/EbfC family DNA-binding protein n=1 Tax=Nocardia salmonicida TaxID=53431 RepID=UPI002E2CB114|nr:YbaB/EbfC family DNA-binding protein [Nocardia salmonicida]